jgi:hypothetical protein
MENYKRKSTKIWEFSEKRKVFVLVAVFLVISLCGVSSEIEDGIFIDSIGSLEKCTKFY